MLQPRRWSAIIVAVSIILETVQGLDYINTSPRKRKEDDKDITTVLLVDNHGKNSLGRFLSVKPDLGLITSTARTFIQDGVTTEYATQVLGTTLDNGRLYAHLLTKTSRIVYDNDAQTKAYDQQNYKKQWNLDENQIMNKHFIRNTDFISPDSPQAFYVFPTSTLQSFDIPTSQKGVEIEILNEAQTNNARVPFEDQKKHIVRPEGVHDVEINAQKDLTHENIIIHNDNPSGNVNPSKVKEWDNLPTFTVRNEFSPSGFSSVDDLPELDSRTERARLTTQADRKARLLFKAGLIRPNPKDLQTVTYTGFADFTTTVANTVIIFTPHTSELSKNTAQITKIAVEPTIEPTKVHNVPLATQQVEIIDIAPINTRKQDPTPLTTEEIPSTTETITTGSENESVEELTNTSGPNIMVINKEDRNGKQRGPDEPIDLAAKFSVLANEQKQDGVTHSLDTERQSIRYTDDIIQPSETQPVMLSTPSDEDIAKILASLQAQAMSATQSFENAKAVTMFHEDIPRNKDITPAVTTTGGATTIFFEDDDFSFEPSLTQKIDVISSEVTYEATTTEDQRSLIQTTSEKITTINTEKHETTTLDIQEETTTQEIITTTEIDLATTPEIIQNEIETEKPEPTPENIEPLCTDGTKIVPTTVYKTLTYLTTFFIPVEESTSTSVKSNVVVSDQVSLQTVPCGNSLIQSTGAVETTTEPTSVPVTESIPTTTEQKLLTTTEKDLEIPTTTLENKNIKKEEEEEPTTNRATTLSQEITTERRHVTESEPETTESSTEEGDEVELIFKTLYTTYTYLTTYFQDSTSSVASRIVVTTNVITSTLDQASDATDPAVAGLLNGDENIVPSRTVSFDDLPDIQPTTEAGKSNQQDAGNNQEADTYISGISTPVLDDRHLHTANGVKTFYTTYTYFTTIFVDGETEISSRTEVYTNYVTPSVVNEAKADILPTKLLDSETSLSDTEEHLNTQNRLRKIKLEGANNYISINRHKTNIGSTQSASDEDNTFVPSKTQHNDGYVTLNRGELNKEIDNDILDLSEYETISTMVTDVRSSTSKGDERIIDSLDKRNVLLDDQIVSESNNESEIVPSPPTLLLQTSYTTFTYFTTMYHGTSSSDVISRLETVTNVVTTTLTPTQTLNTEDQPITYLTTFTYWTTLYKDGQTKVTSREETVSNVVTPDFKPTEAPESIMPLLTSSVDLSQTISPTVSIESSVSQTETPHNNIIPSTVGDDELTTFYTTYTYYTTSYIGDETVLNSRLETVTNVLNKSDDIADNQIGRAINSVGQNEIKDVGKSIDGTKVDIKPTGLLSTIINTSESDGIVTAFSTDVFGTYIDGLYAKVLESTSYILTKNISPSSVTDEIFKPTGVVSINQGKIVDADGISTLFYTTQAIGTYIDNLYAQVIESTSSLSVDQEKKVALGTSVPIPHRTGLVRLIEGSIVQNQTTTLYESKVLGTVIDGRYAQIIESTSSFILPTVSSSTIVNEIIPTPTKILHDQPETTVISPTPVELEGSSTDSGSKIDEVEPNNESSEEEDEEDDKDVGRSKSRLSFQTKKRTFTPAIRPFASRQRPTFAPKRSKAGATTAATITRSDFTPTVTAVPASKANRFGGRRGTSSNNQIVQPTASGGRRFARPKSTSANGRRSTSGQIKPTSTGFRRPGQSRSTSPGANIRPSSLFGGNSRFRIRPTAATGLSRSPSSKIVTETPPDGAENDLTTSVTDNPIENSGDVGDTTLPLQTTTESARRNNPLLRFRRPSLPRPNPVSRTNSKLGTKGSNNSIKGSSKATTTTLRPKTTASRPNALLNRPRAGGLFPRRNLFTTTTTTAPEEEEEEEDEDLEEEDDENEDDEDTDYESSQQHTQTEAAPTTPSPETNKSSFFGIKPFKRRSKRQVSYSRFRRPTSRTTAAPPPEPEVTEEATSSRTPTFRNRYQNNKYRSAKPQQTTQAPSTTTSAPQSQRKRISPAKPQTGRTQFTLREKDSSNTRNSNFKARSGSLRRTTTAAPRSNTRLRSGYVTENTLKRTTVNPRASSGKSRNRNHHNRRTYEQNVDVDVVVPKFDGTITITYQIPTEATIPVVNGKITEYKNIVTAKISTEVLGPKQYSTSLTPFGKEVKVLLTENTSVNNHGATLVTQYLLNESPTTSVIFTPTQIRGRKTSFSHVIPSTVYQVEELVNTIQPALAAQAPLANILLSQLLLGGGVPANPLLALQNPGIPSTPTTEFKTRTTTYVTTVTSTLQTVIPLTFRGKEILTTISDIKTEVVTATEFLTDTVVVTPTLPAFGQAPQLNTILLPFLQQQLQQQQTNQLLQPQVLPQNVIPQNPLYVSDENFEQYNLAENDEIQNSEPVEVTEAPKRKPKKNKKKPAKVEPPRETSVVTLYVSGRTPGEFTTILSTVTIEEVVRRKRDTDYVSVKPSYAVNDFIFSTSNYLDQYVEPGTKDINIEASDVVSKETDSLESIIGDVANHVKTKIPEFFGAEPKATKRYSIKYIKASNNKSLNKNKAKENFFV